MDDDEVELVLVQEIDGSRWNESAFSIRLLIVGVFGPEQGSL